MPGWFEQVVRCFEWDPRSLLPPGMVEEYPVEARNTWHERGLAKPRCGENEWGDGWDSNPQRLESQSSEETTHNAWDDPKAGAR